VVTNVGGFTADGFLEKHERRALYDRLMEALSELDLDGVEVIPQTMPPYPWHFGGQRFHNLFVDPEEIAEFCQANHMRICFDVAHSKLACNEFDWDFSRFTEIVAPLAGHFHISDCRGANDEGLQIDALSHYAKALVELGYFEAAAYWGTRVLEFARTHGALEDRLAVLRMVIRVNLELREAGKAHSDILPLLSELTRLGDTKWHPQARARLALLDGDPGEALRQLHTSSSSEIRVRALLATGATTADIRAALAELETFINIPVKLQVEAHLSQESYDVVPV